MPRNITACWKNGGPPGIRFKKGPLTISVVSQIAVKIRSTFIKGKGSFKGKEFDKKILNFAGFISAKIFPIFQCQPFMPIWDLLERKCMQHMPVSHFFRKRESVGIPT